MSNDPLEAEADRIADHVLDRSAHSAIEATPLRIRHITGQTGGATDMIPSSVETALGRSGRPLDSSLQQDMGQRFGYDFSKVRVHSGGAVEQSARDVNAAAYTVGHDIVFGANKFAPTTREGRRLIAHELTHVVQQSAATNAPLQRQENPQEAPAAEEPPSLFTIFIADPSKRSDKVFARRQARADAARIQELGTLSLEDRHLVNAKLRFFEGDAKAAYTAEIRPVLVQATRKEIELKPEYVGKVADSDPIVQERIRRRRQHTFRFFAQVKDYNLEAAYVSRLQRYLDEGMEANSYWDVEMIEQIIDERAPDAPWHAPLKQDFLAKKAIKLQSQAREKSLPTLPPYWQNQFGALAEQTAKWPESGRVFARSLLWKWREHVAPYDSNPYLRDTVHTPAAEDLVFKEILSRYEHVVRDRDRAIQEECRRNPPDRLMKVWGDPCKPWFGASRRGENEIRNLAARMRIFRDEDGVPYRNIVYWLEEYIKAANALPTQMAGVHLEILQAWSMVQGGLVMANKPVSIPPAGGIGSRSTAPALGSRSQSQLPPGEPTLKVGDIHSPPAHLGLGPQRVVAIFPEGELLKPVTRMPPANRALPAATPTVAPPPVKPPSPAPPAPKMPAVLVPRQTVRGELPAPQANAPVIAPVQQPAPKPGPTAPSTSPAALPAGPVWDLHGNPIPSSQLSKSGSSAGPDRVYVVPGSGDASGQVYVVRGGKVQTFSETNRTLAEQQKRGYLTDRAGSNVLSLEEMQGKKVLDLAAGTKGRTVQELRERKIDASGMDIALSEKAAQTGSLRRGDLATAVPFKEKFDIVYEIYGGLSYGMGQQTGAAFQNAISRLKPGGTLYLAPLSTNAQTALLPFVEEVVKRGGKLIRSKFHADEVWRVVMPAK